MRPRAALPPRPSTPGTRPGRRLAREHLDPPIPAPTFLDGALVRLILARHGRTAANVTKALDSRPPGMPLDAVGLAQADALGRRLANEPVTAVYASRATRAQQTAAPVAAAHGLDVVVVDGLQEVFIGDLEGRDDPESRERFEETYRAWNRGELDAHLPGGESALDLRARFLPAIDAIRATTSGTVVLVSHGAAIRVAVGALLGEAAETLYVPNAGVVILSAAPEGWTLEHWDPAKPVEGDVTGGGTESGF
jgi:broad specificity phosphatase PhoE